MALPISCSIKRLCSITNLALTRINKIPKAFLLSTFPSRTYCDRERTIYKFKYWRDRATTPAKQPGSKGETKLADLTNA